MARWSLVRTTNPDGGMVTVDCSAPALPMQATLRDLDTGMETSVQMCWDPRAGHLCDNLDQLAVTFTPNDWGDDCP
jgi:hypothetical protein